MDSEIMTATTLVTLTFAVSIAADRDTALGDALAKNSDDEFTELERKLMGSAIASAIPGEIEEILQTGSFHQIFTFERIDEPKQLDSLTLIKLE
jgi:hypothetical protein